MEIDQEYLRTGSHRFNEH